MNFKKLFLVASVFTAFIAPELQAGCSNGSCSFVFRKRKSVKPVNRRARSAAVLAKIVTKPVAALTKTVKKVKIASSRKKVKRVRRYRSCASGTCSF